MPSLRLLLLIAGSLLLIAPLPLEAQNLGTFRWQLQPFCHVLTLNVVQEGSVYRLDGSDDLCGSVRVAPASGLAVPNPDGTIGFGVTIVDSTSALPIHVAVTITLPSLGGSWRDSLGNGGAFRFTPGPALAGGFRPVATRTANELEWRQPSGGAERGVVAIASEETDDTGGNGAGIYGQWGGSGGFVSPGNAGVRGDSAAAVGVVGVTSTGRGLLGIATGGGTAVHAQHATGGVALDVSGALKVSGPVMPAFTITSTVANTDMHVLTIDHPLANARPDALLFVTHDYGGVAGAPAAYWNHPTGIYYEANRWRIYAEDIASIPPGVRFNVLVVNR